jgi:hypothetical protein
MTPKTVARDLMISVDRGLGLPRFLENENQGSPDGRKWHSSNKSRAISITPSGTHQKEV